jgi:hypothetical protein
VLQIASLQDEATELHDVFGMLDRLSYCTFFLSVYLYSDRPGIIGCSGRNRTNMQDLNTEQMLEAMALRVHLERYQASQTLRIPPDDVNRLAKINEHLGYGPVNWWCSGCVVEALTRMYSIIDKQHEAKPISINATT